MKKTLTTLACLALTGAAVAGCGGGGAGTGAGTASSTGAADGKATPSSKPAKAGGGSATAKGGTVQVAAKNIRFVPANITVKKGQTIKWTNKDPVAHNVTADSGASFHSGTLSAGQTYTFTPTKAGKIHYYCTIHGQQQSGTITVTG